MLRRLPPINLQQVSITELPTLIKKICNFFFHVTFFFSFLEEEVPKRLSENNTDEAKVESEDANSDDEETQSEDSDDDDDEMPNEQEIIENVESVPLLSTSS